MMITGALSKKKVGRVEYGETTSGETAKFARVANKKSE